MFWFDFLFLESWNTLCSLTCGVPLGPCDVFMTSGFVLNQSFHIVSEHGSRQQQ